MSFPTRNAFKLLFLSISIFAADLQKNRVVVKSGSFMGTLLKPNGGLSESASLELIQGKKVIASTKSDKKGEYRFQKIPSGHYVLRVQAHHLLNIDINVTDNAKIDTLKIVMPPHYAGTPDSGALFFGDIPEADRVVVSPTGRIAAAVVLGSTAIVVAGIDARCECGGE